MKDKTIAVLIPCYNEEKTIGKVVSDFKRYLPEAKIYVYDNNSQDYSIHAANEQGAIVVKEYQQGKGFVIRSMFRDIDADCYIMVDGDDTYPVEDAIKLAQPILEGKADMSIGDRLSSTYFVENKRLFHNFGNKFVRFLINTLFRSNVKDIITGCRAFNKKFVKSFPVLSNGFEIETEMTIHALDKRFLLVEQPIQYRDRPEGSISKLNTYSDGFKVLLTILKLFKDYKPLIFIFLLALSIGLFVPIWLEFVQTGIVPKIPTLIGCLGLGLSALLSFACGLILDTIKKHSDQFYELTLNLLEQKKE